MRILLENCRIIDGKGILDSRGFIVIEGNRIRTVGQGRAPRKERGDERIDIDGRSVLPGMIDCHVHLCLNGDGDSTESLLHEHNCMVVLRAAKNAYLTLLAGVTTVRDLGAKDDVIIHLRNAINAGIVPGPRISACVKCVCITGGHFWPVSREADGEVDIRKAVREQLRAGADVIKLMATSGVLTPGAEPGGAQLTYEELKAGVEEAHKAGRRAASHVMGAEGLRNALMAGIDSIEHGAFLDEETVRMFLERKAFLVPTLSAPFFILKNGVKNRIAAAVIERTELIAKPHVDSAKKAYRAGITIAMGTDVGTPFNLHGENLKELELLCGIGLTPMEAITAATLTAARLLDLEKEIGTIEEGKRADLIVVEGNPLEDITLLQKKDKIVAIMKDGRFYKKMINSGVML